MPKPLYPLLLPLLMMMACRKETGIQEDLQALKLSTDTVRYDTVFTTRGSVTTGMVLFNTGKNTLRIGSIRLAGGPASAFQINADGWQGPAINQVEIAGHDSLHLFITVNIDPSSATLPFLVRDSILIEGQGSGQKVMLEAWGQSARFLRNAVIKGDIRFDRTLPYVILGGLQVAKDARLTIDAGTRIYLHADAPILVDGTLSVQGTAGRPVVFTGDRLDEDYRNLPASWPGIYLRATSRDNRLTHARILNAYNGMVVDQPADNGKPKLTLDRCVIDNAFEGGLVGRGTSIDAENCQITNCGKNIFFAQGGEYRITHGTVASFSHAFIPHKYPVMTLQNWDSTRSGITSYPMAVQLINTICWGEEESIEQEISVSRRGTSTFSLTLQNALFRGNANPVNATIVDGIRNQSPQFDSVNTTKRVFDFRLQRKNSPAVNRAAAGTTRFDLDDIARDARPDIGCYERH